MYLDRLPGMVSADRTLDAVSFVQRLPILRIIASVALALLLVVSAWMATTHVQPEAATTGSSLAHVEVAADPPSAAQPPVTDQSMPSALLHDAAGCVLGVLCGLLVIVVHRRLLRARQPQLGRVRLTVQRASPPAPVSPRTTRVTLTQLGISRT